MDTIVATVKYLGPTETRGSRYSVRLGNRKPVIVPLDHSADNPRVAAVSQATGVPLDQVRFAGMDDHYLVTLTD